MGFTGLSSSDNKATVQQKVDAVVSKWAAEIERIKNQAYSAGEAAKQAHLRAKGVDRNAWNAWKGKASYINGSPSWSGASSYVKGAQASMGKAISVWDDHLKVIEKEAEAIGQKTKATYQAQARDLAKAIGPLSDAAKRLRSAPEHKWTSERSHIVSADNAFQGAATRAKYALAA